MFAGLMPERAVEDILAARVRVSVGGQLYELPVLPRAANRRWKETIEGQLGALLSTLDATEDVPTLLAALTAQQDALLDLLISYDQSGVLPSRDVLDETATDADILRAVMEVWRAANPLVGIALAGLASPIASTLPEPTSSPRPNGTSPRRRSKPS